MEILSCSPCEGALGNMLPNSLFLARLGSVMALNNATSASETTDAIRTAWCSKKCDEIVFCLCTISGVGVSTEV